MTKLIMLKETLQDAEPPRVLSEMIAESYIAAQSAPIKLECLLSASRKESLFDEQFVLIQKYRVGRGLRRPSVEAGGESGSDGLVDGVHVAFE